MEKHQEHSKGIIELLCDHEIELVKLKKIKSKEYLVVDYGLFESEFGEILICCVEDAICHISFCCNNADSLLNIQECLPGVRKKISKQENKKAVEIILGNKKIKACVTGTDFQIKVWILLLSMAKGSLSTYKNIATGIGKPNAVRAVGNAVGKNPLAVLIPCHRIVRSDGYLGGYRWGVGVKEKIIRDEGFVVKNHKVLP